jgi:hypothetical protein
LIASVERKGVRNDEAAWPPPYYNIVLTIPQGYHYRIRNKWPGEALKPGSSADDLSLNLKAVDSTTPKSKRSPRNKSESPRGSAGKDRYERLSLGSDVAIEGSNPMKSSSVNAVSKAKPTSPREHTL